MAGSLTRRRLLAWGLRVSALLLAAPGAVRAAVEKAAELAAEIHRATRNTPAGAVGKRLRRLLQRPRPFKIYPDARRIPLPARPEAPALALEDALARAAPAPGFAREPISLGELSRLLHASNGVTGRSPEGLPLRAAPSAGALYAGEVYVVARNVTGLASGVYYYAPLDDALFAVGAPASAADTLADALEEPARAGGAACAVILTNVFLRYRVRYANRGYRYALIDSGHIGENLRLATASAGLAEWGPLRFHDDRLNRMVGVDGLREAVCAVHLLGRSGPRPPGAGRRRLAEAHAVGRVLPEAADDPPERYHEATKLFPSLGPPRDAVPNAPSSDAAFAPAGGSAAPEVPLPGRPATGRRVEPLIEQRRSARRLRREPAAAGDLGTVLEAAVGHGALVRAPGIELLVFVHRVAGVAPGLYRARPGSRALAPLRAGDLSGELREACLGQAMASEAAFAFLMVGHVEEAVARSGQRAWRDLCIEAGAVGQRIYLACEAVGLAARNLAAFFDDRLNALVDADGRRRAVLHLTVAGPGE
ncbi:MAG: SagB/ThcOx family dehydrogenase [Myxococcota bacterium]